MKPSNLSPETLVRLFSKGLVGTADRPIVPTIYTGRLGRCPLCPCEMLRPLITGHIMGDCPNQRDGPHEPVVMVALNGSPERHWEKD
jgi:hypothetical protein